jgi:hypothetical protein
MASALISLIHDDRIGTCVKVEIDVFWYNQKAWSSYALRKA